MEKKIKAPSNEVELIPFSLLSTELICLIFSFLNTKKDFLRTSLTCKLFYSISKLNVSLHPILLIRKQLFQSIAKLNSCSFEENSKLLNDFEQIIQIKKNNSFVFGIE